MTSAVTNTPVACPGCVAMPTQDTGTPVADARLMLSLPTIHCQNCIASVEKTLAAHPGVHSARVNLTLKRALIDAAPEVTAAELIRRLEVTGFEAYELDPAAINETATRTAARDLLMRLAVAGFASMNVMLLSVAVWSGATDTTRDLFHWISAAITLPAIAFSAQPFFRNAWSALRAGRLNMDVPISLAILLALVTSLWETWLSGHHAYFDAALTLTFFLLAGRWLDARARSAARSAAEELTALEVPRAWRIENATPVEVSVAALQVGDHILVHPGARAPVDGIVTEGRSEVDRSMLTGETLPEVRRSGDAMSAGEVNLTGPLTLRATAVGQDTSLQRMAALVAIAESGRSRYTSLADRAAKLYAPGVHILSALAFLGWLIWSGDMRVSLNIAAAVLIITCPCALGLAVPAVTTAASGRLFGRGLLIKNATALERLAEVDTVVFDKTGTLTTGHPSLTNWSALNASQQRLAYALAKASAHPLSRAIAEAAQADGIEPTPLDEVIERPGYGTMATVERTNVRLGRPEWVGIETDHDGLCAGLDSGTGNAVVLRFEDKHRPGAVETVSGLQDLGIDVILLSGDRTSAVDRFAQTVRIADWHAEMLPEEKARFLQRLKSDGRRVLMVGDGLNDTAALAAAHVSISPAQALDAARAASDMVLLGRDLSPISEAVSVARMATRRIRENFRIATLYNIVAVPLAVAGLATPLIAALAMSTSSISVSLNALRVRGRG
ncbi:cadmium-translocating P-type ATPase [Roseobacter sp. YSTF-M11]|uniref:Cadmium-translocating P-type ATPase n=1 Tax=Roseobacter insulae TaxID=2859783 RepID=A0A9X1K1L1_9RHOB|nr:heavy metal translocating P-type ATPase [Roseobacter insulae]MBW4709334.1 cadmium-translocating P-type ATPase [Roseobacter insulae]